jgi:ATP-dependent helicase/nuclease subunit A
LIWQIYRKTRYLSFVSALPNGRSRRANLLKLHDRAIQFEGFASSAGNPSLGRFVEFIEKLREAGQDWAPAEPEAAVGDAVRILSVHKSKGLEFPVVFLAELESRFNKRDVHADCLADTEDALGLRIIDPESNSKLRSLAHEVIAERKLATALAEEMRILYVATTRARDRLILTASQKHADCREIITNGFFFGDEGIPDWQLRACRSPLEWVLYGLSDQRSLHEAFGTALEHGASDRGLFGLELHERQRLRELSEFVVRLKSNKARRAARRRKTVTPKRVGSELLSKVKESIDRTYRFGEAPSRPAKSSVTQLTHRDDEYVRFDYSKALERRPRSLSAEGSDAGGSAEPKLIGSATHLVICQLDLGRQVTPEAVERTKRRLVSGGAISRTVAERVDTESIAAFFASEPGRLVLNCENTVWREWPFTFALPDSEYRDNRLAAISEGGTPETIVVQGIIDMLIRTRHGLVVVDFKTDNISPGQIVRRAELYRGRLELYSRAASAILKRETLAMWLYFLTPRRAFEVTH